MDRALIDASLDCFELYGVRKTSLTDVATRAGVSRASVYRAFGSKSNLLKTVVAIEVARFFEEAQEEVPLDAPLDKALPAAIGFTLDWVKGHKVLQRTLLEEPEQLIDVIIERPGRFSPLAFVTGPLSVLLAGHPEADRLRTSADQAAEWLGRVMFTLVLAPTTTLGDHLAITRLAMDGLVEPRKTRRTRST